MSKVIAMYMRLSVADDDFEEDESNSIKAQRDLMYQYINEKEEFKDYEIEEFCDDGYSGTNFDRPGVKRMLELAESGIINVIIVKDFSRFGRNSIDVGHYIEEIFPYTGLRFIAINDCYDSNNYVGDTGGFEISIKNLISQIYAQDASKKIKTSFQSKARNGEYIGFQKIYGYVIDESKKLILDKEPAEVVKKIFEMRSQGKTYDTIAKYLNDEKNLVPRLYFKYNKLKDDGTIPEMSMWTRTILHKMINNEQYTGKLIFGRYKVDKIRGKTATRVPRDKWIISENAHEPIVSEELFNIAKSKKRESRKGVTLGTTLFSGKVVCGCCGRNFYTWSKNHILLCQTPVLTGNNPGCYDKKIRETDLISLMEDAIKCVLLNRKEKTEKLKQEVVILASELSLVKRELQNEVDILDRIRRGKEKLFQKLMDNQVTDDEYMRLSKDMEWEEITVEDKIGELKKKQKTVLAKKNEKEITIKVYIEIVEIKKIDRHVVEKFIDKMIVSKEGRVGIQWTFKEIFQSAERLGIMGKSSIQSRKI